MQSERAFERVNQSILILGKGERGAGLIPSACIINDKIQTLHKFTKVMRGVSGIDGREDGLKDFLFLSSTSCTSSSLESLHSRLYS